MNDDEDGDGSKRYRCINIESMKKYKTIEIRVHDGCINTELIGNWIKYLVHCADGSVPSKEIQNYVKERIKTNNA